MYLCHYVLGILCQYVFSFDFSVKFIALYSSFRIIDQRYSEIIKKPPPFENCEYVYRITGTVSTDKRIMSFVNTFWGFEVTGGSDQNEPLTIIAVSYQ